jgi:hypothetical protein
LSSLVNESAFAAVIPDAKTGRFDVFLVETLEDRVGGCRLR